MTARGPFESPRSRTLPILTAVVPVLMVAWSGVAFAAPGPETTVRRGGELFGPSTPTVFDGDLRDLPRAPQWKPGDPIKEVPRRHHFPPRITPPPAAPQIDPLLAVQDARTPEALGPPILNFAGQGFTGVNPPDTVGDVGIDHFVQAINASGGSVFTVYNKVDGSVAAGPLTMDAMGTGNCAAGAGDPVVLYDQLANRWFLSEFSGGGNRLCIYISQTSNPISGGWFAYQFTAPGFPDYPKYGVWPDAYYASSNESSPAAYAFDRAQMLVGGAATAQRFTAPDLGAFGFQALIPADADGATPPPAGAPNPFMRHRDDEAHNPPGTAGQDFLEIWEFHVDWATPASSTFTGPINIPIAEIDSELCGFTSFFCFPQPSAPTLDPLREVVMNRLQYRNFGSHQTLVGNLVTDVDGTNHGGIRWFELRNVGSGWSVHQEGTYAPDIHHRWMGSAAMDGSGNIGVGYSVSSTTLFPSIRFNARLASDPLGTLQGEVSVIAGTTSNSSNRWGDYAAVSVDPVNDRTFWVTTMYSPASSWATRIATFELCDPPGVPTIGTATAPAANRIDVTWLDGAPGSDSYNVYRALGTCAAPAGSFVKIADSVPGFTYQDTTVSGGSTYAYRVTGLLAGCESAQSACVEATATGVCFLPPVFAGIQTVTNPGSSTCTLDLGWNPAISQCGAGVTYKVHRSTTPGFTPGPANQIAAGIAGTTYLDGGPLTSGTTYEYVVRATDTLNGAEETNTVRKSGAPTGAFSAATITETFEGALSGGGFDTAGWTHSALSGATDWVWSTAQAQTPTHSWFSDSLPSVSHRVLVSPTFGAQASTTLSFFHTFDFEFSSGRCFDAGTLEVSSNGGPWTVMPDAHFTAGIFNGTADAGSSNPIGGKRSWCDGAIGAMTQVAVNLGSFNGQMLQLRWHEGDDVTVQATGWFVDSATVANALFPSACSSGPVVPGYHSLVPCRLVDTRGVAGPALLPNSLRTFDLNAGCGIPVGAKALSVNVTVTEATAPGHLTLFPVDIPEPAVSSINFNAGQTRANNGVLLLPVAGQGDVTVRNAASGTVHLILDVNGYFE